jgi:L-cystine uptake protein TcyP (sodium:dicarboxylate symporter family)
MDFCKHSELFGQVGKDLHSYRVFDIAVVDVLATVLSAYLIVRLLPQNILAKLPGNNPFLTVSILLFGLGIISHRLFCVRSTIDKLLFP